MNKTRNDKLLKAFGQHLRQVRKKKGMTMETLAFEADIEYRQLGRIERGEINTTISSAAVLAKALDVELSELFKFRPSG